MSDGSLWIFGYGSLVWRPAFAHRRSRPAFIEGYARRFWQGSTDHRGLPGRPGRVVTLLPGEHESLQSGKADSSFAPEQCWGTAYEVAASDPDGVLAELDHRERGGYERLELELFLAPPVARPREGAMPSPGAPLDRVRGLVYVASPENENYLGPASLSEMALQIAGARGPSGANPEYVFELARSLRRMGVIDSHVFEVADAVAAMVPEGDWEAPAEASAHD